MNICARNGNSKFERAHMRKRLKKKTVILLVIAIIFIELFLWAIWENTALMINEITIESDRVPVAFDGFCIAQISDLHNAEFGTDK